MMMTLTSLPFFSLPDNCFYNSHYNFFAAPQVNGISIYGYIYLAIAITLGLYSLWGCVTGRSSHSAFYLWVICWVLCLGVTAIQTAHQVWYLNTATYNVGNKSDDERYRILYQYPYEIARIFTRHVPPGSTGLLVSDSKIGADADVDALPYFLYPRLDLVHRNQEPDYLFFYLKNDVTPPVPGLFRRILYDKDKPTSLWIRVDDDR